MEQPQDDLAAVAALSEPARRRLYGFVREQGTPVSREAAAAATGMSLNLVAFHLDKLVSLGLLKSHHGRLPDAPAQRGRAPKLYQVSGTEISASVPARSYDLSSDILLDAIEAQLEGETPHATVLRAARARGMQLGQQVRADREDGGRAPSAAELAQQVLDEQGFEPYLDDTSTIRLRNCAFHRLAQRSPDLVCSMNRAFIEGLLRGVGDDVAEAALAPREGQCCVAVSPVKRIA
ncbi:MAG: transcriptional regulator [Actinomycetota bacterium]|nr:transcriptional regulator [Actinomycetota bacterium]